MTRETDSDEFDAAILALVSRSADAMRCALYWVETSRRLGDLSLAQTQQGLVVQMLCDGRFYLDIAEDLARDLVRASSTRTNLELLVSVLNATGQAAEAAHIQEVARQTELTEEERAAQSAVPLLRRRDGK
jgi:hypothetical protein